MASPRICSVDGCGNHHHSHGYCRKHARRYMKFGDPETRETPEKGEPEAWLANALTLETDQCIAWPYGSTKAGYGLLAWQGNRAYAHRIVCEMEHGPAPTSGMHAAHRCGNANCVNKRHLRWATPTENAADKIDHGTTNRGERHGIAKLSERDVREIRERLSSGEVQREIAAKFGVQVMAISNINRRKTWGWLV